MTKSSSSHASPPSSSFMGGMDPPPPPPIITNDVLQFRLDTGNMLKSGGQRGSLTRCVQKYEIFWHHPAKRRRRQQQQQQLPQDETAAAAAASTTTTTPLEIRDARDDLTRELQLFELEMTKMILWGKGLERQVQENKERMSRREQEISTLQQTVKESGAEAHQFLETQNCQAEYEALAKLINDKHPTSQEELEKKILSVQEERTKVDREIAEAEKTLKVRESQFQLLMQYMLDLKQSLKEEEKDKTAEKDDKEKQVVAMEVNESLYGDL